MLDLARKLIDALPPDVRVRASELFPEAFPPRPEDYVWHISKQPFWPRKTTSGHVVHGYRPVWRRRRQSDDVWEFQEEQISMEEWCEDHF